MKRRNDCHLVDISWNVLNKHSYYFIVLYYLGFEMFLWRQTAVHKYDGNYYNWFWIVDHNMKFKGKHKWQMESKNCQLGVVAYSCNPATGGLMLRMIWGRESWCSVKHVDWVSALSSASIWTLWGSPGCPGCLRRDESGQGGNPAAKSPRAEQ